MVLKPKSKLKPGSKRVSRWPFHFPNFGSHLKFLNRLTPLQKKALSLFFGFTFLLYFLGSLFDLGSGSRKIYPPEHGYYAYEIPASRQYIFPFIEHGDVLKEIGVRGLYTIRTELDGVSRYVYNSYDKPLTDEEKKKTSDQILLVKRSFLDHGKLVYRKDSSHPEVVIVTLIDFENYSMDTIVNIVQNRVDYAQKHNYGVYVRWSQEFIPLLKYQDVQASYEYIKPMIMRAAMHAFPQAKYVFFVDQNALIMNLNVPLQQHVLNPKNLDLALLRNSPVVPNSNIKTYTHFQMDRAKIFLAQGPDGMLDLSSFIVSADMYGKAFLEFLIDPLFMDYDWPSFEASIGHLLQWHPQLLKKAAVVMNKIIAATYDPTKTTVPQQEDSTNALRYTDGDLVVSFKGCKQRGSCASDINTFYSKIKK